MFPILKRIRTCFHPAILLAASTGLTKAEDLGGTNRAPYTLFNPTPESAMRAWYTDNAGNSPYTIDAGHFAASVVAMEYGYAQQNFTVGYASQVFWGFGDIQLKAGLLNDLDVELVQQPYQTIKTSVSGVGFPVPSQTVNGFGDLSSRLKWNLWGNNGGPTALAISGSVFFPTGSGPFKPQHVGGGPEAEFAAFLPIDFQLRVVSNASFYESSQQFENLISLTHRVAGPLEAYCSFNTLVNNVANAEWVGTVRLGLNYRPLKNLELFTSYAFAVNTTLDSDYIVSLGVAGRF